MCIPNPAAFPHLDVSIHPCQPSWRIFSPQTSPSGTIYPMVGVPSMCPPPPINLWQYSTLHLHPCTCSEPGCTATLGHACPSMFPIAWRNFHHKPARVAPFILWLEYLLCAHHTHFPIFQLLGTHVDLLLLFCQPGPSWLVHHLTHPSVHLSTPLCNFLHPFAPPPNPAHPWASPSLDLSHFADV